MQHPPACRMFHLLAAGDSRRHDDGVLVLLDCREQPPPSDRHRHVVVFLLEPERARHAAASGIHFFHGICQCHGFLQIPRTDQRLLVTMAMDQRLWSLSLEFQLPASGLLFLHDEFFQQEMRLGDIVHCMAFQQIRIFVAKCQDAAWLAANDRVIPLDVRLKLSDIESRILAGLFRQAF